jgi:hypothetical protein
VRGREDVGIASYRVANWDRPVVLLNLKLADSNGVPIGGARDRGVVSMWKICTVNVPVLFGSGLGLTEASPAPIFPRLALIATEFTRNRVYKDDVTL